MEYLLLICTEEAKDLAMSEEEAAKFKETMKKHHEAMRPLREKRRALMENLEGQVKAKAKDSEISATLCPAASAVDGRSAAPSVTALPSYSAGAYRPSWR